MLDFDETLAHVAGVIEERGPDLTQRMENQSDDLSFLKKGGKLDPDRLKKAHENYKHKDNVLFTDLETRKYTSILILRPHLCKFLNSLQNLPKQLAKNVTIFTGNIEGKKLIKIINSVCNTSIPPHQKGDTYHKDSIIVDDDRNMAFIKLYSTGVEKGEPRSELQRWVKIKKFTGDLRDNELLTVSSEISQILK